METYVYTHGSGKQLVSQSRQMTLVLTSIEGATSQRSPRGFLVNYTTGKTFFSFVG